MVVCNNIIQLTRKLKVESVVSGAEDSEIRSAGNVIDGCLPFEERLFAVGEDSEQKLKRLQNYVEKCKMEKEQQNAEKEKKKDEEEKDGEDEFCNWILGIDKEEKKAKEEDEKVKEEEKRVSEVARVKEGEVARAKEEEEEEEDEEEEKEKTDYNVDLDACKNI